MRRREFLIALSAVTCLALAETCLATLIKSSEKTNIVLINVDDLGYGDLGCYGATKVKTPNIDRLASQGRLFSDAHSASAVCTPSWSCLHNNAVYGSFNDFDLNLSPHDCLKGP